MRAVEERVLVIEQKTAALEERMTDHRQSHLSAEMDIKSMLSTLDDRMERRFDALDRRFLWVVALQITTLLGILGAALSALGNRA